MRISGIDPDEARYLKARYFSHVDMFMFLWEIESFHGNGFIKNCFSVAESRIVILSGNERGQ
jgi:hypothetical protein